MINLSLGGQGRSAAIDQWVDYALDHNVAVVAAAGNDGVDTPNYPAASPGVVSVGATDHQRPAGPLLELGDTVDLVAPGMDITSTRQRRRLRHGRRHLLRRRPWPPGWWRCSGPSKPDLPARDVANRVVNSAKDIAGQGRDPQTGRGLLDAAAPWGPSPGRGSPSPAAMPRARRHPRPGHKHHAR